MRPEPPDPSPVDPDLGPRRARRSDRARWARVDVLTVIGCGGVVGATGRYLLARAIPVVDGGFPTATFVTNLIGSFLLGFVVVVSIERLPPGRYLRPFLAIGVLGSFTTFSTFAVENVELVDHGAATVATIYVAATLVCGIAAARAGIVAARFVPNLQHRGAP